MRRPCIGAVRGLWRLRAPVLLCALALASAAALGAAPGAGARGAAAPAGAPAPAPAEAPYAPESVIVRFRARVAAGRRYALERLAGAQGARFLGPTDGQAAPPLELRVPAGGVARAVARLRGMGEVAVAEPDYVMSASATPNDPSFGLQWGDLNTGQSIPTQESNEKLGPAANGTAGADDRAAQAWGVTTGSSSVVIGETDTGISYEHPDLAANVWSDPGGLGGCAAGTHGFNVLTHTCNPLDDDKTYGGHGTHVAGILGAVGNNGTGVAGMNWHTSIVAVKWLNSEAFGETSGLIEALQWLVKLKQEGVNVRVVNDSATFVGTARSQALSEEIDTLGTNGILFVTAAGNTGQNNDEEQFRRYPCGYDRPTEICVTATDNNDQLPSWANYGPHTVDLAAPGVSIYSTLREGKYGYLSGGSMASPQVAGAAALILSAKPSMTPAELKTDIVGNVDPLSSLSGKVISGGRLDVCKALPGCTPQQQPATFGNTSIGANADRFSAGRKRVNRYTMPVPGSVTKLSIYLAPTGTSGQEQLKGIVYQDSSGKPGALLAVSNQLTFTSTGTAGWYELPLASPLSLPAGPVWIGAITGGTNYVAGFRWTSVAGSRLSNANSYSSGPSNPFGSASSDAEQMSLYATYTPAGPKVPSNTALPQISGKAVVGEKLSAGTGTWTEGPTSYEYSWERCNPAGEACSATGVSNSSYTLASGDEGATLRVAVTARNETGPSQPARSLPSAIVAPAPKAPSNTSLPQISGNAVVGEKLSASTGGWSENPTSYEYSWERCNAAGEACATTGVTSSTYTLAGGDEGATLRVAVTARNGVGPSQPATSPVSAVVGPAPKAPSNMSLPQVSGNALVGEKLSASTGGWSENPTSYEYSWERCNAAGEACATTGVTSSTYTLAGGDEGSTLRVVVTARNSVGPSQPATSAPSAVVQGNVPSNNALPQISGKAVVGEKLSASTGGWTEAPTSYEYSWERCNSAGEACSATGVTTSSYTLAGGDEGSRLRVAVTARDNAGPSQPARSLPTAVVAPEPKVPSNTGLPTISGKAVVGEKLSATSGSWTESPTSYEYAWERCNALGEACKAIGASGSSYQLEGADAGSTVRVVVIARNSVGPSPAAASTPSEVVAPASATFGKTSVGASSDYFVAERKRVNRYSLSAAGTVRSLSLYLAPTSTSGQQQLRGVLYEDTSGSPKALLGATETITFKSTQAAGWYTLSFPTPVKLAAGSYWIGVMSGATAGVAGFRYDSVSNSRLYNSNTFASGPSNPFGSATTDSEQMSLYATYTSP